MSPPGNLYASLLLIDPGPPALSAQLGFVAGVALVRALRDIAGPAGSRIKLKWPNDALADGAKLSGLLLEGVRHGNGLFACVIGFGVNCLSAPQGLPYPTICLRDLDAEACDRAALFSALSDRFAETVDLWSRGENFAAIRASWLENAGGLGALARVSRHGDIREGLFIGIDAQGRMLLEGRGGATEIIEAGDVTFGG